MKVCMEAGGGSGARRSLIFNRAIKHGYRLGARTIVRSRSQLTVTINPYDTIEGSARELTHTEKFSRGPIQRTKYRDRIFRREEFRRMRKRNGSSLMNFGQVSRFRFIPLRELFYELGFYFRANYCTDRVDKTKIEVINGL